MKNLVVVLCLAFCFPLFAASPSVDAILQKEYPSLEAMYKQLHQSPELSYFEAKTSALVADELRKAGFEVTTNFGKYADPKLTSYGVVAVLKNGAGPTVYVRTDMDALPVEEKTGLPYASTAKGLTADGQEVPVMHACGHDLHMTIFVGTARALSAMRDQWKGTLILIGQPAEELAPGGAEALLNGGLYSKFPKPDYVLGLHDDAGLEAGKVGWVQGYVFAAVDSPDIIIHGKGGHGAYPYLTKDPVVIAAEVVTSLQTIVSREVKATDPAVVTVGTFHAGTKRNIIPDDARLELTVRSYDKDVRQQILAAIQRIAKGIAAAGGGEATVDLHPEAFVPATYNNPDLVQKTLPAFRAAVGEQNVVEREPVMGGEDFSRYSLDDLSVPAFQFMVGAVDPAKMAESKKTGQSLPSLHSSLFAPLPEPAIKTGIKAMTAAVMNLMK